MTDESRSFSVEDWNPLTQRRPTPKRELDADGKPIFRVRSAPPWTGDPPRSESITQHTVSVGDLFAPRADEPRREVVRDFGPNAPRRNHLQAAREAGGLSRGELAAAAYVPEAALQKIEEDGWKPPESMGAAIAATLGRPEGDLFTDELLDPPEPDAPPTRPAPAPTMGANEARQRLLRLRGILRFARNAP